MASGKKNYFRHSFFARNDLKLKMLRDRVGVGFYFYYFSLLEQCGEASSDELKEEYVFHDSTIRNLWCINLKKSERVAIEMMSVGLLEFKKAKNTFQFKIPNLAKYMGKYDSKSISNAPNKIKENEIKEKENEAPLASTVLEVVIPKKSRKKNLPKTQPQEIHNPTLFEIEPPQLEEDMTISQKASNVLTLFNTLTFSSLRPVPGNMKHINARLKEGYALEDFKAVIELKHSQWVNNPRMAHCIRPQTFFSQNFDSYLQEARNANKPKIDPLDALFEKYTKSENQESA